MDAQVKLISYCILLFYSVNGQCQTDCSCVPISSPSPENHCCLYTSENLPPGSHVGNTNDLPLIAGFGAVMFEFAPNKNELGALFSFSETTGAITTAVTIDREAISVEDDCIGLTVRGVDGGGIRSNIGRFGIVIQDVNDNHPQFDTSVNILNITVQENNAPNTLNCESNATKVIELRTIRARDSDDGSNAQVTYKVAEGPGSSYPRACARGNAIGLSVVCLLSSRKSPDLGI